MTMILYKIVDKSSNFYIPALVINSNFMVSTMIKNMIIHVRLKQFHSTKGKNVFTLLLIMLLYSASLPVQVFT